MAADPNDWLIPQHDPTSQESREERTRALDGLTELGIDKNEKCPICFTEFNIDPENEEVDNRHKLSMKNRLFSCGCQGSGNKHVFHQYCLAAHCCTALRNSGRAALEYDWDEQGIGCPICRRPMGIRRNGDIVRINLIGTGMHNRPAPVGGTKRRKKRKRTRKR